MYIYICVCVCVCVCVYERERERESIYVCMCVDTCVNPLRNKALGVMVIVAGLGHGDTSSNPGLIAFHIALIPLGKV